MRLIEFRPFFYTIYIMKTLVLIPTLNAEEQILDIYEGIKKNCKNVDVLVINQGSSDRTTQLLQNNNIPCLEFPVKAKYYDAVALGIKWAEENKYDALIEFDDKGRFSIDGICSIIDEFKYSKKDFIFGSRYLSKKAPFRKKLGNRLLRISVRLTTGKKLTDPSTRFKLYGKQAIKFFSDKYDPTPDRIVQLIGMGYTYSEIQSSLNDGFKYQSFDGVWSSIAQHIGWILSILFVRPFRIRGKK